MAANCPTEEQQLHIVIASLEGRFSRLQYEFNQAQSTIQSQQDHIHGLKEELEWQKCSYADVCGQLQTHKNNNNSKSAEIDFSQERLQLENTIKTLRDQLDIQNRLIASLTKVKSPSVRPTNKDIVQSITELRTDLRNLKQDFTSMIREVKNKFKDMNVVCRRLSSSKVSVSSRDPNTIFHKLDRQSLKEFCDEIEEISSDIMKEIKNL